MVMNMEDLLFGVQHQSLAARIASSVASAPLSSSSVPPLWLSPFAQIGLACPPFV